MKELSPQEDAWLNVTIGQEVLMDIRSGVTPVTYRLTVIAVTLRRFVAEGLLHGRRARWMFRKADGRSVGGKCYTVARRA